MELVPLALCDRDTPDAAKDLEEMLREMLTAGRPQYFPPQKPAIKIDILHRQPPLAGGIELFEFAGE